MQLSAVPWRCVVIDEAHRLKNRNCKLLEGLNNLSMVLKNYFFCSFLFKEVTICIHCKLVPIFKTVKMIQYETGKVWETFLEAS